MGLNCLQITDLNSSISSLLLSVSHASFKPLGDLLDINLFQCFTPETIPRDKLYGDNKKRSVYEQACFASHYSLVSKLRDGEEFIIMEHDAYLWPEHVDHFKSLWSRYKDFDVFYPGISNEFYTLTSRVAEAYVENVDRGKFFGGPLSQASNAYELTKTKSSLACWPVVGQKNLICISNSIRDCMKGRGDVIRAPITQCFNLKTGSTIKERLNNWKTTKEKNPDMFFVE